MVEVEIIGVVNEVPEPTKFPDVIASNQLMVPPEDVAPKFTVPVPHTDPGVVPVIVGMADTVTVCDTEFEHPPLFTI